MSGLWHTDGRTDGGKWKIGQCSGRPETAKMSVCIPKKKHFYNTFASCITCSVVLWKTRKTKLFRIYKVAPISIIAATVFSIIAQFCVATIMFYNTLATIMFFQYLSNNNVLQYLGNNNVFQYIAEAHKKPPPRAICYLPATLAGHPPNKHPSTLCTNNREIEHQLYLRIWPVKDRNATTMAPVEGCLLNVTRNRAQRLRH